MDSNRIAMAVCVVLLAASSPATELRAQVSPFSGQRVEGKAVVVGVQGWQVLVSNEVGNQAILDFNPERVHDGTPIENLPHPVASVVGPADPSVIGRGFTVRISGKIQNMRQFIDPISELTITGTQIQADATYGVFPDESFSISEEEAAEGVQAFVVSGQITQIRGDRITIAAPLEGAGNEIASIVATVSPEVLVDLDATDYRLAGAKDQVEFEGYSLDGSRIFVFHATFTKPAREAPAALAVAPAAGAAGAPQDQEDFGAGIPEPPEDEAPEQSEEGEGEGESVTEDTPQEQAPRRGRLLRIN